MEQDATEFFEELQEIQKSKVEKKKQEQEAQIKAQQEQVEQFKNELTEKVTKKSEEVLGVKLTPKQQNDFLGYITKVNPKTGKTPYLEQLNSDPDIELKLAYMAYSGMINGNIPKKAETEAAKKLANTIKKSSVKSSKKGSNSRASKYRKNENSGIDLSGWS